DDELDACPFLVLLAATAGRVGLRDTGSNRLARDHLRPPGEEAAVSTPRGRRTRLLTGDPLVAKLVDRQDRALVLILGIAASGLHLDLSHVRAKVVEAVAERLIRVPQQDV